MKEDTIALVGSNSIHTIRYLMAIAPYFKQIVFITNGHWPIPEECPNNIITYTNNFKLLNLSCQRKIANILLKHKIKLVHIQQANSYAYHTLKAIQLYKINCKTILTTWGSDILVLPKKGIIFKRLVKFNLNHTDIITSDSLYMSEEIRKLAPHSKTIHTINFGIHHYPNCVDMSLKQNIILSNRLHKPLYNIDKIIAAFAKLIKNNKHLADYKLIIAASGPQTEYLIDMVNKLGLENSVNFVGMLSYTDLINYYKVARIFISLPSSDATSLSVIEAIGYGCYPILSNIPANLEWVLDGINGSICQNNEALDNYILNALKTVDFEKTAKFNHDLIGQKAIFENNLPKFLNLYDKL
ncbi:MAG: glycosyl transferase family 1 [Burkholderiales bacterium]|jgi:glycosyltransferase involved in cell wall biosynthesis|nr:glycosyl transferase family 1 [Burkholderiales bacterium]